MLHLGDQDLQFILAIEPISGLPAWVTTRDEFWVLMVGNGLYEYLTSHMGILKNSSLSNKNEFAASMTFPDFKASIMSGEVARFKDCALALKETIEKDPNNHTDATFVCFFSDTSDHCINIMFDKYDVNIGVMMM